FPRPDELHRSAGQPRQLGDLYEVFRDWVSITAGSGAVHRYPFARQAREIAEGMTYPLLSPRIPCTARHPRLAAAVVKPDGRIHRLRRDADGMRQDIFRDDRRILAVERSGRPFDGELMGDGERTGTPFRLPQTRAEDGDAAMDLNDFDHAGQGQSGSRIVIQRRPLPPGWPPD